jgi:hypothetical protein
MRWGWHPKAGKGAPSGLAISAASCLGRQREGRSAHGKSQRARRLSPARSRAIAGVGNASLAVQMRSAGSAGGIAPAPASPWAIRILARLGYFQSGFHVALIGAPEAAGEAAAHP